MNNLFIKPVEFEKVSYRRVSENPAEWTGNIMEAFYSQFPFFANSPVKVNLTQKEEQKGYALGSIEVKEGDVQMVVPVIIQNRELFPFDVAIMNNQVMPLTSTTLNLYVQGRSAFLRVVRPDAGDPTTALFNNSFSQVITPTFITDQYKTASLAKEADAPPKGVSVLYATSPDGWDHNNTAKFHLPNVPGGDKDAEIHFRKGSGWEKIFFDPKHKHLPDQLNAVRKHLKEGSDYAIFARAGKNPEKTASMKDDMAINSLKLELMQDQVGQMQLQARKSGAVVGALAGNVHPTVGATIGTGVGHVVGLAMGQKLMQDRVLDRMYKEALIGGQPKADLLFSEAVEKAKQGNKGAQYLALCFRKWAADQGFTVSHWDIPGFEKVATTFALVETKGKPAVTTVKVASMLDTIAPTITPEMKQKFFDTLQKNASIAEGFKQNGTQEVILKLASLNPGKVDFNEKLRKELDRDIHYIYKTAGEYKMILGNSRVDDAVEISVPADVVTSMGKVKTAASYMTKEANFNKVAACIQTPNGPLAILADGNYCYVPPQHEASVAFVKTAQINDQLIFVEPEITKSAMWASFGYSHIPFSIDRIWNENGQERIETSNGLEKRSYCRMTGIDEPYTENGITYLPANLQIIKLGKLVDPADRFVDGIGYTNEVLCVDTNAYRLIGTELSAHLKTANVYEMDYDHAAWALLQCGATEQDLAKVAALKAGERYLVNHEMHVPISFEKVASKMRDEYDVQVKAIRNLAKDFIKEASIIADVPTVDATLALNFVNRDNVIEFAKALPQFEEVSKSLADMLLKTRLGVRIVDENVIRRVMLGIVDIIEVLAGISNLAGKK